MSQIWREVKKKSRRSFTKFCERLQGVRKDADITQDDLALMLDVSRNTCWRWESGDGEPSLSQLQRLAEVLGVTVAWLATGEGEATPHEKPTYDELLGIVAWQAGRIRELENNSIPQPLPRTQGRGAVEEITTPCPSDDAAVAAIRRRHPGPAAAHDRSATARRKG